jgi:CRISPR type I-E-associated protein CasB/Cse2
MTESSKDRSGIVEWLKNSMASPSVRSALTQGDNPRTLNVSYPYAARWFPTSDPGDRQKTALLGAFAVVARTQVNHAHGVSLGDAARTLKYRDAMSEDSLNMMIAQIYRTPIRTSTRAIESILRLAESNNIGVDYGNIITCFRWWDVNPNDRRSIRRRTLNDYYTNPADAEQPEKDTHTS